MWTFSPCRLALHYGNSSALLHFAPIVPAGYAILLYLELQGLPSLSDTVRARRCGAVYASCLEEKVCGWAPSPPRRHSRSGG